MEDDSTSGQLGSYECHAYAVNSSDPKKYGFSVNVISGKPRATNYDDFSKCRSAKRARVNCQVVYARVKGRRI